jgi:hypothetical protein
LFLLRGVNQEELILADAEKAVREATSRGKSKRLAAAEIGDVFGIAIEGGSAAEPATPSAMEVVPEAKPRKSRRATKPAKASMKRRAKADGDGAPAVKKKVAKKTAKQREARAK